MSDPLIVRFAEACGAAGPLDLRVELAEGGMLAEGTVEQPFTLIGRDDSCDVTLSDPDVNPRHAWFQVIGGRVFAVDLGSRTGLTWADGKTGPGWLDVGSAVGVGPFRVKLRGPRPTAPPQAFAPLESDPSIHRSRPVVRLEFRNGKRATDHWTVNRVVTLVGRAPECKLHLNAEDISRYHCGLVLTPTGLWVVDLSGRGVVVNGERMRVAPLGEGAELWVGRFLIGVTVPAPATTPVPTRPSPQAAVGPKSSGPRSGRRPAQALVPEDEVPLGEHPVSEVSSGLPSSHIMADAFRLWAAGPKGTGPVSSPILVSGSGPSPSNVPVPPDRAEPAVSPPAEQPDAPIADPLVAPFLRQLGEIQSQMFEQFQQSLVMMLRMVGNVHREQMAAMQQELARIQELNAEVAKLQNEVARLAMAQAAASPNGRVGRVSVKTPLPDGTSYDHQALPAEPPAGADATAAIQDWVLERINTLQQERQSRWQKLVGLMTDPPGE